MKHKLRIKNTEEGTEGTLSLWGDLTVNCARETRDVLLEVLQNADIVHLDLQDVETADITLIQMICATSHECLLAGKKITLDAEPGGVVSQLLRQSGYCKQVGCPEGGKPTCLWDAALVC
jgi:anti-anti-sigma regulatory factor